MSDSSTTLRSGWDDDVVGSAMHHGEDGRVRVTAWPDVE